MSKKRLWPIISSKSHGTSITHFVKCSELYLWKFYLDSSHAADEEDLLSRIDYYYHLGYSDTKMIPLLQDDFKITTGISYLLQLPSSTVFILANTKHTAPRQFSGVVAFWDWRVPSSNMQPLKRLLLLSTRFVSGSQLLGLAKCAPYYFMIIRWRFQSEPHGIFALHKFL